MKLTVLGKLLLDEGWQVANAQQGHHLFVNSVRNGAGAFITPVANPEEIPSGTYNAILCNAYQKRSTNDWRKSLLATKEVRVVLEKQSTVLWARLELPGLLAVTRGCNVECVLGELRSLLLNFAASEDNTDHAAIDAIQFDPVYDTTIMWELLKQLKTNHIANETGVDSDLLGRFMTGASFPCIEQATRLEKSIRELGRQLMEVSIR